MTPEQIVKNRLVEKFALKHTDEQCGLDVANVHVYETFGLIRIIVNAKPPESHTIKHLKRKHIPKGMIEEWRRQAKDLIEEIGRDPRAGYGGLGIKFRLEAISDTYFELREMDDMDAIFDHSNGEK